MAKNDAFLAAVRERPVLQVKENRLPMGDEILKMPPRTDLRYLSVQKVTMYHLGDYA